MVRDDERGAIIAVKAVPGASRDEIVGPLGDRLKVRVAAAPEGGKANKAICALLAKALGVRERDVSIIDGASSSEKRVRVTALSAADVRERLGMAKA